MRKTDTTVRLALALMTDPSGRHWGYDLMKKAHVRSGTLYPILQRFLDEGWVTAGWQDQGEVAAGRPRRRYYELTNLGRQELGALADACHVQPSFRVAGVF